MTHPEAAVPSSSRVSLVWLERNVLRRLGGSFGRHVAVVIGGTALGQVIIVAASPVLTRLYTPADFGLLSVYVSVLGLGVVAASLRYEVAIPLPDADEDAANLLALSLLIVVALTAVSALLALFGAPRLLRGTSYAGLAPYAWMLPLSILGAGTYQALTFWALRKQAFGILARTKVTQSIGQVATQIGLGLLGVGPAGLLGGDVVGRTGGSGTILRLVLRRDGVPLRAVNLRGIRKVADRYRRFPLLASGSALLNAATLQAPLLLLAVFYGPVTAGLFALGQRVLAAPMSLIGTAVGNVYYSALSAVSRTDKKRMQPLFWRTTKRLALLGAAPAVLAGIAGPWACRLLFGSQWAEAGTYLRLCAPMLLVQFVASPLGGTLDVLERQDLHLAREVVRQLLSLGALVAARLLAFDAWTAVLAFGVAGAIGNLVYIGSTWYALRDLSN